MEKWFIISLVIAILIGVFAISNGEVVSVNLFFTSIQISQAIVIFISALLGAVIVAIFETVRIWKLKRQVKDVIKKLSQKEIENNSLLEIIKSKEKEIQVLINKNKEDGFEVSTDQTTQYSTISEAKQDNKDEN
ncbi:MAG: LapA family protein [Tissierellia bacterium]|nr:LapA family protein [Tissierellia bacterium]